MLALNATLRTTLLALLSVSGLPVSSVAVNVALLSTQAMSDQEPFSRMLLFFRITLALAFGIAAACSLASLRAARGVDRRSRIRHRRCGRRGFSRLRIQTADRLRTAISSADEWRAACLFGMPATLLALTIAVGVGTTVLRWTSGS